MTSSLASYTQCAKHTPGAKKRTVSSTPGRPASGFKATLGATLDCSAYADLQQTICCSSNQSTDVATGSWAKCRLTTARWKMVKFDRVTMSCSADSAWRLTGYVSDWESDDGSRNMQESTPPRQRRNHRHATPNNSRPAEVSYTLEWDMYSSFVAAHSEWCQELHNAFVVKKQQCSDWQVSSCKISLNYGWGTAWLIAVLHPVIRALLLCIAVTVFASELGTHDG